MATCIVFDLDDTLYKEAGYVRSAYSYISVQLSHLGSPSAIFKVLNDAFEAKRDAFGALNEYLQVDVPISKYLEWYRTHCPTIQLSEGARDFLEWAGSKDWMTGLITDGRSMGQRNKIRALGLDKLIEPGNVVISEEFGSEKPDVANYRYFMDKFPGCDSYIYVGDNVRKDFVSPNALGWITIGIRDNGENIHGYQSCGEDHEPQFWVDDFVELKKIFIGK